MSWAPTQNLSFQGRKIQKEESYADEEEGCQEEGSEEEKVTLTAGQEPASSFGLRSRRPLLFEVKRAVGRENSGECACVWRLLCIGFA